MAVLDSALQRQAHSAFQTSSTTDSTPSQGAIEATTGATREELSTTAEGQGLLEANAHKDLEARRHGRGPKQGEMVQEMTDRGLKPTAVMLRDQARAAGGIKLIERWKAEMPTEQEMLPRDKYSMFDRKAKHYRKGVHSWSYPVLCSVPVPSADIYSHRAAKMDESQPETQSTWILRLVCDSLGAYENGILRRLGLLGSGVAYFVCIYRATGKVYNTQTSILA